MLTTTTPAATTFLKRPAAGEVRPLPFRPALAWFLVPGLFFRLVIYTGLVALPRLGLTAFDSYIVAFTAPLAVMLAAALALFKAEAHPLTWAALRARFRLKPMRGRDWLVTLGALAVGFVGWGLAGGTARWLIEAFPVLAPPAFFPALQDPRATASAALFAEFVGEPLLGNWRVPLLYAVLLALNIVAEEFWWRGLLLPRQERAHGRWAWLAHGSLWALFHVPFYPWQIFALLPICLSVAWASQRRQSTTPGLVMHLAANAGPTVIAALLALGVVG